MILGQDPIGACLNACALAGELLKGAGFEHRWTSMQSEAVYYGWPGRDQLLRVAAHRHRREERRGNGGRTVAKVTFSPEHFRERRSGLCVLSRPRLLRPVEAAIGRYFLVSAGMIRADERYREIWLDGGAELPALLELPE